MQEDKRPIKSFSIEELATLFEETRLPKFRVMQVLSWMYVKGVCSYDEMTNLPKTMREQLDATFPLYPAKTLNSQTSQDESRKYLIEFHDGALAETVGIPSDSCRLTVCASTQSGCAMGCIFCATGKAGLTRSLEPGEIVDQILTVQEDFGTRVTNVVLMGQGEPFANYDNTIAALRILNHPKLLNIGARHLTVSTCGIIEGIRKLAEEPEQFTLAVSLHSALQESRNNLIPAMSNQRLDTLRLSLKRYAEFTGRRFTFEYALMKDVNDMEEELNALIDYCRGLLCHVNLIPLNAIEGSSVQPSSGNILHHWQTSLEASGIASSIRNSRGNDISAACGQLSSSYNRG